MMSERLPEPRLTKIFRLEASLGEALDLGNVAQGRRRIVPLTGGTFVGPELNGALLPGAAATSALEEVPANPDCPGAAEPYAKDCYHPQAPTRSDEERS